MHQDHDNYYRKSFYRILQLQEEKMSREWAALLPIGDLFCRKEDTDLDTFAISGIYRDMDRSYQTFRPLLSSLYLSALNDRYCTLARLSPWVPRPPTPPASTSQLTFGFLLMQSSFLSKFQIITMHLRLTNLLATCKPCLWKCDYMPGRKASQNWGLRLVSSRTETYCLSVLLASCSYWCAMSDSSHL